MNLAQKVSTEAIANQKDDWPHAPVHQLSESGIYMVTCGTFRKAFLFHDPERLDLLEGNLLKLAKHFGWQLEAWAVFANHYHFIARSLEDADTLRAFLGRLHTETARVLNRIDGRPGRKVWHNYWDTRLTYERSYFARLRYVHHNAVRHGLVKVANQYPWCSATWFEQTAPSAMVKTVYNFKTDKLKIYDVF